MAPTQLRTLLAPVDFSDGSNDALAYATMLAQQFSATLIVLHIGPHVDPGATHHSARRDIYHKMREEEQRIGKLRLGELCDGIRESHPNVTIEPLFESGTPHDVICRLAIERDAEMIVMATNGLRGLSHFLIGSTAERVVRMSRIAVLTVRPGEK
ncbi:MAG: nucleotide-binding universal stress UspA family protein [Bradymonadia bacterium]|jgi:nucleotide-binding universal stress UspA family protein